ncbi:Putative tRNA 2'-phosphotransferase [Triticum urartu]|uniref:2'-phosphotransferase n=2 Tax=Triticum urartu TaxID=4572 RepID=M7YQJ9_TRIUA|nr:Putative tRNA 2'-phosphotransferase [Triticum urartu]
MGTSTQDIFIGEAHPDEIAENSPLTKVKLRSARSGNAVFLGSGLTREGICMSVELIMMAELYSALMGSYAVTVNADGQIFQIDYHIQMYRHILECRFTHFAPTRVLRHMAPELRLNMRSDGYVRVRDLLRLNLETFAKVPLNSHTVDEIREAVRRDNKQRFGLLEEDGELLIRANQGHTVTTVTSESLLKPILSADEVSVCVHGTYRKNVDSILKYGLKRMARLHVHFSSGLPSDGGVISGMRSGANILIYLNVRKALQDGMKLYISDNKVILTEGFDGVVPVKYFEKIETWPGRAPIPFQR